MPGKSVHKEVLDAAKKISYFLENNCNSLYEKHKFLFEKIRNDKSPEYMRKINDNYMIPEEFRWMAKYNAPQELQVVTTNLHEFNKIILDFLSDNQPSLLTCICSFLQCGPTLDQARVANIQLQYDNFKNKLDAFMSFKTLIS